MTGEPTRVIEPVEFHLCEGCGHYYQTPVTSCDCMADLPLKPVVMHSLPQPDLTAEVKRLKDEVFSTERRLESYIKEADLLRKKLSAAQAGETELLMALERIERWHGEFPATGRYWDEPTNSRPMSYETCFGSNGERDFMRQVASKAITNYKTRKEAA